MVLEGISQRTGKCATHEDTAREEMDLVTKRPQPQVEPSLMLFDMLYC